MTTQTTKTTQKIDWKENLKVYNTMTRRKEKFVPVDPDKEKVGIYVCGVTPYNVPHIGNARPFVTWDAIRRFLKAIGYQVRYIQNFTDVDDKIIRVSNERKCSWKDVSDLYIKEYFAVMDELGVQRADVYPRVSEMMDKIIEMVAGLIDKGFAYELEGDVYYSVEKFAGYGKLSGRSLDDMMAGARVEVDLRKKNPMDFALWKKAKPGEPSWSSPWGEGRPGWHIECSVMSRAFLGDTFDFHGGGSDLIFPHHENEIAQSQAYCGDDCSFARYWLHNGFITIHDEKMSKSKNNFFTVADILKKYRGEVVRFFILQTHYRSPLDFSDERLKDAQASLARLANTKKNFDLLLEKISAQEKIGEEFDETQNLLTTAEKIHEDFFMAMCDDFNTAQAIGDLFVLAKQMNVCMSAVETKTLASSDVEKLKQVQKIFAELLHLIGICEHEDDVHEDTQEIEKLIAERMQARKEKNWKRADEIRDELKAKGILLKDTPTGTQWTKE